jgi:hypothetical protein
MNGGLSVSVAVLSHGAPPFFRKDWLSLLLLNVHHLPAVDLDGDVAGAQFGRDLRGKQESI